MTLTLVDFFCGAGGSSQGAAAVPGVEVRLAANHWQLALDSHATNFPRADHLHGDIREYDVAKLPRGDLFWSSPECPRWSGARGVKRDFHVSRQPDLFGETLPVEADERSRALMWDVPRYLAGMARRGEPVLGGVVENVVDVRAWDLWNDWLGDLHTLGYRTRVIALNSMHAAGVRTLGAPQSRDRLYVAYWLRALGRDPDWDKWLRPAAHCPTCDEQVRAVQTWKRTGQDMGRYRQQYVYRCPRVSCRHAAVEPFALPAAVAIDWSLPGQRIGDRNRPLSAKTLARIEAGLRKFARPITLEAARNTFERRPGVRTWPVDAPLTTQTTTATKALAYYPLLVPAGGTWNDEARPVDEPMRTRTTRETEGLAVPPFITVHRGGEGDVRTGDVGEPLATVCASGNHHGLVVPPLLVPVEGRDGKAASSADDPLRCQTARNETGLLMPFLAVLRGGACDAMPVTGPTGTLTASGNHYALVHPGMVMRNNGSRGDGGEHCTPLAEPMRTLTTAGHQSVVTWQDLLVPYYRTGVARPVGEPFGTIPTVDRYALVTRDLPLPPVEDCRFRMLEPHEIGRGMAFADDYTVLGNKRERVRQYGNAVTPPVAELIVSALVEAITGEDLEVAA